MSDPTRSVPYEQRLAEWARGKVAAGADPQAVTQKVTELTHAYRAKLATAPETPEPETTGDKIGGAIGSVYQGLTMGAGNKIIPAMQAAGDWYSDAYKGKNDGFDFSKRKQENDNVLNHFKSDYPVASAGLDLAGGIAPAIATAGGSAAGEGGILARAARMMGKGAAYGGTSGALSANHFADIPGQAAVGVGIGAVGGGAASVLGDVAGNVANRTGMTDKAANLLAKIGPTQDAAEAMGTRGQVNATMGQREDLLNALDQTGKSAGRTQLDRIAATKAKADKLYGIARKDQQAITDPRVQQLLQDPEVQKAFTTVKALRSAKGNPVPQAVDVSQPPASAAAIRPEDWQNLMSKPTNAQNMAQLPAGLTGVPTVDLPDPEALSTMKRYLGDAAKGLASPLDVTKDKAIATMDKVRQLRDVLHDVSEPWKTADSFYADAKGQEEAYAKGYDAFKDANNPSGAQLPKATAPAMAQQISTPRYAAEPVDAMDNRADAFRSGAKARAVSQVQGAPVDKNLSSVLNQSAFAPDQTTQGVRSLMFNDPAKSAEFENQLATMRGAADNAPSSATRGGVPTTPRGLFMRTARGLLQPPDMVSSGAGGRQIAAMQADPAVLASKVAAGKRGQTLFDRLRQIGLLAPTSTAAQEIEP